MKDKILEVIDSLVGRTVTSAYIGIGSFVTFNLTRHSLEKGEDSPHLRVLHAAWRLERNVEVLLANTFDREHLVQSRKLMDRLNNLKITKVECTSICNDLVIFLESGYVFRTFTCFVSQRKGRESWEFYTTDGFVAVAGSGAKMRFISGDAPDYG